jgi:hypothetical protein
VTNAWGASWGLAWGESWLAGAEVVEPEQPAPEPVSAGIGSLHPRKAKPRRRFYDYDTDEDAARRRPVAPKTTVRPPQLRVVHDTVEIAGAAGVAVFSLPVEVTEHSLVSIGGRAVASVRSMAVQVAEAEVLDVAGTVLVEAQSRAVAVIDRGPLETQNTLFTREVESLRSEMAALRAEMAAMKAQSAKAHRDAEALQVLLLAA